jgi:hypothetical protein
MDVNLYVFPFTAEESVCETGQVTSLIGLAVYIPNITETALCPRVEVK